MTITTDQAHVDHDRPTYIYVERPRCPCGSVRLKAYKTMQNGDGTLTRYSRCRDCGERLILIVE